MPVTVSHAYSATTPENAANGEVGPNAWNSTHAVTFSAAGSEIFGAFSNDPSFNVTFTTNGGGRVVANAPAALSVTGANGSSVAPQTLAFSNSNGMTLGVSTAANGATVTGSYTVPGATVFSNSNNVSFGLAGSTVTATATFAQSNQAASAANGSFAFQTLSFSNVNGVSFGTSAGSAITASISQSNQAIGVYGISNTTQNSSGTVDARSLSIAAYGIISVGTTNGSIVISSPDSTGYTALSIGNSNLGNTAGDTGVFTGRVVFVGSNNITLSGSSNGISQTISIIGGAGGGAALTVSDNATSLTVSRLAFTQSNGITMSLSTAAGAATVIASYTVPTQSNQTVGVYGSSQTTGSASSGTHDARSMSFIGAGLISIGNHSTSAGGTTTGIVISATQSNQAFSAQGGSSAFQTLSFSNANGISFTNTAGQVGASYTVPIVTDYFSKTNTTFNGANISGSITINTAGLQLSLSAAAPGAAVESNAIKLLGANTAGNTTATGSTIGWSGVNITLSGTNNSQVVVSAPATSSLVGSSNISISTNGSTITIGQVLQSYYENVAVWQGSTTLTGLQSTSIVVPLYIDNPISFGFIRIPMTASCASSSTAATTGNTQFSYGHSRTHNFVLYSRGVGANSLSLQSVASTSLTDQQSFNVSANANSTQFSYTNRATYQSEGGSVGFTYDYSSSAASLNFHTSGMTAITGQKMMAFPWATSLSAGQYWLAYGVSSSTASQFTNIGTKWFNGFSNYGVSQANVAFGTIGANTNSSVGPQYGVGSFTTAGGGTTNSIPISAVSTYAAHMRMAVQLANIA